jgi:hypothetical protein
MRTSDTSEIIKLPVVKMGRPTAESRSRYQGQLEDFCQQINKLRFTLDFIPSARGWCYYLEGLNVISKGQFDQAQRIINDCRKSGMLPIDICSVDENRSANGVHYYSSDGTDFEVWSYNKIASIKYEIDHVVESATLDPASDYYPYDWTDFQNNYVEMMVEKIDLVGIFKPVCKKYGVAISNRRGWGDINSNAALMRRFRDWENKGKHCVLLYCGDHDPGGLFISDLIRKNLSDLSGAVGWSPDEITIDRFGLNYDFIQSHNLTWIDNLETSGKDEDGNPRHLDDENHTDRNKPYVKNYIDTYGVRKVEANALMSDIAAGRQLCEEAILKYIDADGIEEYRNKTDEYQSKAEAIIIERLTEDGIL